MIPSGLASSVVNRASLGDAYVRVRDSGLVAAVAQFLYDEVALLDERGVPRRTTAASAILARHRHPRHSYVTGSERQACYDPCRETSGANRMAEAAKGTLFRGLVASGWHTAAITMRLQVGGGLPIAGGIIGLGGEVGWPTATRPGDVLHVDSEIVAVVPSRSRPDRGTVTVRSQHPQPTRRSGADNDGQAARPTPFEDGRRDSQQPRRLMVAAPRRSCVGDYRNCSQQKGLLCGSCDS